MTIIAHVTGPSGSGKSTIGKLINKKYPYVKNVEVEEIRRSIYSLFAEEYMHHKFKNHSDEGFLKKYLKKGIEKYTSPYKYVVLFGGTGVIYKKEMFTCEINTEHKYFIDIDEETLLKRSFIRHLAYLKDNAEHYYEKAVNNNLSIDFNKFKDYKIYNGESRLEQITRYDDLGYEMLSQKNILQEIYDLIEDI